MSDSTAFTIAGPGPGTGGGLDKSEHVDHLLTFVTPIVEVREGSSGAYDAAVCDYVLCHTCQKGWADLAVTGTALVPRIGTSDGEIVAGVLTVGEANAGRTAPYLLGEPDAGQLEKVSRCFAEYATKLPTGRIVVDVEAFTNPSF